MPLKTFGIDRDSSGHHVHCTGMYITSNQSESKMMTNAPLEHSHQREKKQHYVSPNLEMGDEGVVSHCH